MKYSDKLRISSYVTVKNSRSTEMSTLFRPTGLESSNFVRRNFNQVAKASAEKEFVRTYERDDLV